MDAHPVEHRARLDPVADLGDAAGAVESAGDHLDTVGGRRVARSRGEKASRQARSISSALPKRSAGSRRSAREKKAVRPSRSAGSKRSTAIVASSSVRRGSVRPSPKLGGVAGQHLMQGHGDGVALGVKVPARRPAIRQERVEIGSGAGGDGLDRCAREREVEEDQTIGAGARRPSRCRYCPASRRDGQYLPAQGTRWPTEDARRSDA